MEQFINVKPDVLKWTRISINMDLSEAIKRSKLSEEIIKEFETGERKPTLKELNAISKAYNKSLASLLLNEPPKEKPLPKDRRTVNSEQIGLFDIKTIKVVEKARALSYSLVQLKNELNLPIKKFYSSASLSDDPLIVAQNYRKEWNLNELKELKNTNLALEGYIEKIENLGVAVFQLPLTKDNLRGFSINDEEVPIVAIKRGGELSTAKLFTLFHEVGHILLNESGICDIGLTNQLRIEKWCNSFAAEILVPSEELLKNKIVIKNINEGIKEWSSKDLTEIGNSFFVSRLVILRKLYDLKKTTKPYYEDRLKSWNKPPFGRAKEPEGRNIPKEIIKERGKLFLSLAFNAYEQNVINLKELSDYLGAKLIYISKIRQHLYGNK